MTEIISAPPAPPLSQEEKRKRYELYRSQSKASRFAVVGNPNHHYLWAPRDDGSEMTRLDMEGYWIVREKEPEKVLAGSAKPSIKAGGLRQDGTYVIGDVILTACELEVYEFHLLSVSDNHDELLRSAKENFVTEAEKAGVPVFQFSK